MRRCHDHATAGRAGSGGDGTTSGAAQGEAAFPLGEDGCSQPTDYRGPDQRAGGAKIIISHSFPKQRRDLHESRFGVFRFLLTMGLQRSRKLNLLAITRTPKARHLPHLTQLAYWPDLEDPSDETLGHRKRWSLTEAAPLPAFSGSLGSAPQGPPLLGSGKATLRRHRHS